LRNDCSLVGEQVTDCPLLLRNEKRTKKREGKENKEREMKKKKTCVHFSYI
jgi:hypothetical protein